jgi:uncharacterized membrane protein YhaH (DUF805 family)
MNFGQAIALGFSKYLDFTGRASRSEFWFWVLFAVIGAITTNTLDAAIFVYHNGVSPLNSSDPQPITCRRLFSNFRRASSLLSSCPIAHCCNFQPCAFIHAS